MSFPTSRSLIRFLLALIASSPLCSPAQRPLNSNVQTFPAIANRKLNLGIPIELHLTNPTDPLPNSSLNFVSPDAWVYFDHILPSKVVSDLLNRLQVNGAPAVVDGNIRVVQYAGGAVVIPHSADYPAMTVYDGQSLAGASMPLQCFVKYNDASLGAMKLAIRSFRLRRGYMATIAQQENGTGVSLNYVAQDADVVINDLPPELDKGVRFVRIFPWRWTAKKGVAGNIWQNLNVSWYYNWNLNNDSTLDLEYVPIRQNRYWPGLDQDWKARGATQLLGYNEPDHKDQSNLSVDAAISGWPDLLKTGLRVGSPAVSDGGLNWLYDFMGKADAAHLRVDFVAVHYYRAIGNPNKPEAAADQLYHFVKGIHDKVQRPIWITEFNNGANWTKAPKPNYEQEKAAIAKMIEMLDKTPFVERYAIYNWVEDIRNVQRKDGTLTPAGEAYRDDSAPIAYKQVLPVSSSPH